MKDVNFAELATTGTVEGQRGKGAVMKTAPTNTHPPRCHAEGQFVARKPAPRAAQLAVEVRLEVGSITQEEQLRRRACLQRVAQLRRRFDEVKEWCERATGSDDMPLA